MPSSTGPDSVAIGGRVCTDADTELPLKAEYYNTYLCPRVVPHQGKQNHGLPGEQCVQRALEAVDGGIIVWHVTYYYP